MTTYRRKFPILQTTTFNVRVIDPLLGAGVIEEKQNENYAGNTTVIRGYYPRKLFEFARKFTPQPTCFREIQL